MKYSILFVLPMLCVISCRMPESHSINRKEKVKIDSLEQQLHCEIRRSFSHENFNDLPDLELTVTGLSCSADSIGYMAESIFRAYLTSVNYKGKYQNVIVNVESGQKGRVVMGGKRVFRFSLVAD